MRSKAVTVGGQTFACLEDVRAFVKTHVPNNNFELFTDVISFLCSYSEDCTPKEAVESEYQATKVGLTQEAARHAVSYQVQVPYLLGSSKSSVALSAIPKFDDWSSPCAQLGVKNRADSFFQTFDKSQADAITLEFPDGGQAAALAQGMHQASYTCYNRMATSMDSFNIELKSVPGASVAESWSLVCKCVRGFVKDCYDLRFGAKMAMVLSDKSERCARYVWAAVQTHGVMQEYIRLNFREHPTMAAKINLHVYHQRLLLTVVEKLKTRVQNLEKANTALSRSLDTLQGRLGSLEKKVK